ncbi:MAG: hypothetical protein JWR59_913 [Brevundimonas sp.]|nr:hypothetical protein [Brevundimonas sp.]
MNNNATVTTLDAVQAATTARPLEPVEKPTPKPLSSIEASANYRLLIEEGPRKGSFVYKTLDSLTGEIIRQFPREQLVKIAEAETYDKGTVINTTV